MTGRLLFTAAIVVVGLVSGCASLPSPQPRAEGDAADLASSRVPAAVGEVVGKGMVLQIEDGRPELCLGGIADSLPPQCSGPAINGWDWNVAGNFEEALGVKWGDYAVRGTWNGTEFTLTSPASPRSFPETPPAPDPRTNPIDPGRGTPELFETIQYDLFNGDARPLGGGPQNGYLFVTVVYDDGSIQDEYDSRFGRGLIAVESALRAVE